ncbi:MAG: nucleotidyltransferase family protein [Chloroflexota bacterium]|nr:nucleotidyltransferase family protein [Chloroflexota bacterium]
MEVPLRIGAVILAAGDSRRFGGRKQLATLEGKSLLEHVLALALSAELSPVVAVVPVWLTPPTSLVHPAVSWVHNGNPELGMSHSLRLGVRALPAEVPAAVILLGDQPRVPVSDLQALIAARGREPIIGLRAGGRIGPPLLVERSHFKIVDEARGDIGLREVLGLHPEWVSAVEVEAHTPDVDTPDDLAALERP